MNPQDVPLKSSERRSTKSFARYLFFAIVILCVTLSTIASLYLLSANKTMPPEESNVQPTMPPFPTPLPDITEKWQTHPNASLGISFKYPPEWHIEEAIQTGNKTRILLYSPATEAVRKNLPRSEQEKHMIIIERWEGTVTGTYQLMAELIAKNHGNQYHFADMELYNSNDNEIYYREQNIHADRNFPFTLKNTYTDRDGFVIKGDGEVIYVKPGIYVGQIKEFYMYLLSSFKFLDKELAKWKIYKSTDGQFEFKHPETWNVSDEYGELALGPKGTDYYTTPIRIAIINDYDGLPISSNLNTKRQVNSAEIETKLQDLIVDGRRAAKIQRDLLDGHSSIPFATNTIIKIDLGQKILRIWLSQEAENELSKNGGSLDHFLSTFKFTQ